MTEKIKSYLRFHPHAVSVGIDITNSKTKESKRYILHFLNEGDKNLMLVDRQTNKCYFCNINTIYQYCDIEADLVALF